MKKVTKEPVYLRQRKRSNGLISLYLDIYRKGKRVNEYLKLYLVPERTKEDRAKNKETLQLAQSIKAQRIVEIQNGEYGFKNNHAEETLFFDYFSALKDTKQDACKCIWNSCLEHLERYEKDKNLTFADITPKWVQGFRDYLEGDTCYNLHRKENKTLSHNTRSQYFSKLRCCINHAFKHHIIERNPLLNIENIPPVESIRMYLTLDELKRAAQTECRSEVIKYAFLFSCLTGLRYCDILKLKWSEITVQGAFTRIIFQQKKTKGQEYLDITPQAAEMLGTRGNPNDTVFKGLPTKHTINSVLRTWMKKAQIDKTITFHCARHTFAVMMLDLGTDIYTVSKLLGHRELSTTQIYAKVLDKNKQAAVSRIPDIFGA